METEMLSQAAVMGRLSTNEVMQQDSREKRTVIVGINETLDAVSPRLRSVFRIKIDMAKGKSPYHNRQELQGRLCGDSELR